MNIGIVLFNGFTDLDFYLPWDLLIRVHLMKLKEDWNIHILGEGTLTSAAGLPVISQKPYSFANSCDAVLFCSGPHTRTLIKDKLFLSQFNLNLEKTFVAGIDSGSLLMAALGLLNNKKATTYPTAFAELERLGATPAQEAFICEERIATAARCLSGTQLALWIIKSLAGQEIADKVYESVKPL